MPGHKHILLYSEVTNTHNSCHETHAKPSSLNSGKAERHKFTYVSVRYQSALRLITTRMKRLQNRT